uniref:Uncharacterized protein n=1 Tax=Aliivibrio fischeri TaxID=668 RepID=H2ERV5_ALIFS|nr:hypothetical protein [Aliivibrio fischeri]
MIYSNVTLAEFSSFRGSLSPTSQFYEHFTKNDYSTFAIGCGKSKEYTFLTLKITSQKLKNKGDFRF